MTQRAVLQALGLHRTHPGGKAGPGQGDVELAQVFAHTLRIHVRQRLGIGGQVQVQPGRRRAARCLGVARRIRGAGCGGVPVGIAPGEGRRVFGFRWPAGAGKGQEDQRVLQALGFVDGDHLHQLLVAFQANTATIIGVGVVQAQLRQVADQRLGALQSGAGLLQQLGQVQQVGQVPLAVLGQQALGDAVLVEPAPQHGQHALAPPGLVAGAALLHARLPGRVVAPQRVQLGPGQAERRCGQGSAQQALILGRRAGGQPALQFGGHGAVVDRAPV
jgi:hypothetical protein